MSIPSSGSSAPDPYGGAYEPVDGSQVQPYGHPQPQPYVQPIDYQEPPPYPYGSTGYQPPPQFPPQYGAQYGVPMAPYGAHVPLGMGKSKTAAGLLAVFLGSLGVHNFYLGHTGKGVAQLLMTLLSFGLLTPVTAVWGLIEGIMILVSNPHSPWGRDAQNQPLQ